MSDCPNFFKYWKNGLKGVNCTGRGFIFYLISCNKRLFQIEHFKLIICSNEKLLQRFKHLSNPVQCYISLPFLSFSKLLWPMRRIAINVDYSCLLEFVTFIEFFRVFTKWSSLLCAKIVFTY